MSEHIEPSRRGFLTGLAGLAALAVVPGTARALSEGEVDRFLRQARDGYVPSATLMLREPLVFSGSHSVLIGDLTVVAVAGDWKLDDSMIVVKGPGHLSIGHLTIRDERLRPGRTVLRAMDFRTQRPGYGVA